MEGTIGEIRMFAGNFAPRNWNFCNGAIIQIAQNTALFSILGTTYGGNGTTNFALPNLQGRTAIGAGQLPGGSFYSLGQSSGSESVTLNVGNLPAHAHTITGTIAMGTATVTEGSQPGDQYPAVATNDVYIQAPGTVNMRQADVSKLVLSNSGMNNPFSILKPLNSIYYIICLYGVFPQRN